MRRIFSLVAVYLMTIAAAAMAQVQTGSLAVRAIDEQGNMVPGATVVVTSTILPQAMNGVTDSTGL